jgi:hypothetical protein
MPLDHPHTQDELVAGEPISISRLVRTFKRYAAVIILSLAAVMVAYAIVGVAALLSSVRQRTTSLSFRLEFKGAESGVYPNGLRFAVTDITAIPVLLDVYNSNQLSRFVPFDQFSRSMYVLESNAELESLSIEYQNKLADRQLDSIERERIEREYEAKRAAISKSDYALQFSGSDEIPAGLVPKILQDTLTTWARRAAIEKRVLDYHTSVLTPNVLEDIRVQNNEYLVPLLLLRRRVDDIIQNAATIAQIPGAQLIRTRAERMSLMEIRLSLDELIRFRLEPLIGDARAGGLLGSTGDALRVLRAQLSYDERALAAARARETALRNTLSTYESTRQVRAPVPPAGVSTPPSAQARETVMPQISDTFLDRVVDLASTSADREYRQQLTDEIKSASLAIVPLEMAVRYDQELIDSFQNATVGASQAAAVPSRFTALIDAVRGSITRLNEIYLMASRQLYPEAEIYRVLGPPMTRTMRVLSPMKLALGGVLTFLIALPIVLILVLIHNRMREEELAERAGPRT